MARRQGISKLSLFLIISLLEEMRKSSSSLEPIENITMMVEAFMHDITDGPFALPKELRQGLPSYLAKM